MDQREFLEHIIRIRSPTGDVDQAVRFTQQISEKLGFHTHVDEASNFFACTHPLEEFGFGECSNEQRSGDRVTLFLISHLDTVPGFPDVKREGDVIWGRGAVDAKGPFCSFLYSALLFIDDPRIRIAVIGVPDEEGSSNGARVLSQLPPPDHCIIGEPSGTNGITLGYKGLVKFRLTFVSKVEHTSRIGANAVESAIGIWNKLTKYCRELSNDSPFTSPLPHLISMNTSEDGLERTAVMTASIRLPPGMIGEELHDQLKSWVAGSRVDDKGCGDHIEFGKDENVVIDILENEPAVLTGKNSPLVRSFLPSIREAGLTPRFVKKMGTCDMNILYPAWGCPMVAFGPGDSNLDHASEERISMDEYDTAIQILQKTLERIAERGNPKSS